MLRYPHSLRFRHFTNRLRRDQSGNFVGIMGFALIPLTLAAGFGLDYSRAEKLQTQLDAAADAAALAAVSPAMLCQTSATAQATALATFQSQAAPLPGVSNLTPQVTITPVVTNLNCTGTLRTATVTYQATSRNLFSSVLGASTLAVSGQAVAQAAEPPSINFYVLMDTSPSMLLPTTQEGINLLAGVNLAYNTGPGNGAATGSNYWYGAGTSWWGSFVGNTMSTNAGCAFACHSVDAENWNGGSLVTDNNGNMIFLKDPSDTNAGDPPFFRVSCADFSVYDNNNNKLGTSISIASAANTNACGQGPIATYTNTVIQNPVTLTYNSTSTGSTVTVPVDYPDTLWIAQNYTTVNPNYTFTNPANTNGSIQLRIDAETLAAQNLITFAANREAQNAPNGVPTGTSSAYQMQFFTFNVGAPVPVPGIFGTITDVGTSAASVSSFLDQIPLMAGNGCWTTLASCTGANAFTYFNGALSGMLSILPQVNGNGSRASPQSVMVIITDGANDSLIDGAGPMSANDIALCNQIKQNTKIAVLYTQYMSNTIVNSSGFSPHGAFSTFSTDNNLNNGDAGAPPDALYLALQQCATQMPDGTYLMETVPTNGDISQALQELFNKVSSTAKLVQ